jgi:hypothetical protein
MESVCVLGVDFTRDCSCNPRWARTSVGLGLHHEEDELDAHAGPPPLRGVYMMECCSHHLARKPSGLASCYSYSAPMQMTRSPHRDTMHVASVHFKCFRCMLQAFRKDVAKVDRDVTHVATRMFQVYIPNVSFVSEVCYKCFNWMVQD